MMIRSCIYIEPVPFRSPSIRLRMTLQLAIETGWRIPSPDRQRVAAPQNAGDLRILQAAKEANVSYARFGIGGRPRHLGDVRWSYQTLG